ncbi:glycosyltransferase family 2 protein [Aeromicrobium wangtongii]|uniref:4,4'-diaponeurosporenoate glycosyltransferase n=1 Tax=Aeromicrobium wangtongii TaxID=2969247 RepID=A0ABY5M8E4_9ACTN|nr:glycosyltransferase family 2 protein [Aeromicrobium wangtongii]MCD9196899.1 glycosyltransferase family 2 protein [Aeromicrobium wangtongii]UUP14405.1 glycosyltransferase family 2 protein [Aeromicrobium wangtongii]
MSSTPTAGHGQGFLASVVIPAHDEERGIARTLAALLDGSCTLDVLVVCNGCTDGTAEVARGFGSAVRVLEIAEASKTAAVKAGNAATDVFPRVHLDADVTLTGADVIRLIEPLGSGSILATAPRRVIASDASSVVVRWYYEVWEQLPQVAEGLVGRGAFALSRAAQERVDALPQVMSDDLAVSDAFGPDERLIVDAATVVVRPPRVVADLLRRRVRVVTGNRQASAVGVRRPDSSTGLSTLLSIAWRRPSFVPRIGVFLVVTAIARFRARRFIRSGDFTTWQRDESSRV